MTSEKGRDRLREEALEPQGGDPQGGDPACWLDRVCPACGRLTERTPEGRCAACGEEWD